MSEIENVTSLRRYLSGCISAMWSNPDYYLSFLRTSAQMYKYGFQDQVLIHDSRPNALACAESGTWCNDDIHRTLNEGAFAIPLLTTNNGKIGIRYVYDYADTSAIDSRSKSPYFWAITENNEQAIMNALDIHESDIADVLMIKAHEIVSEQSEMYYEDLSDNISDTLLEEFDELNIKSRFENLLEKSVAYSLMSRCGIDTSLYFDKDDFNGLYEFDGIGAMTVLGTAVSDMSEQILRTIEVTIKRERSKENGISKDNIRENSLRTENNVQSGRADANISSAVGDNSAAEGRKIRDNANGLSQKTPQGELQSDAAERNAERSSVGNRQNGEPPTGADAPTNDGSAGRDGAAQGTRPNAMGRADEQRETASGGDNPKRTDIQLNNGKAELNGSAFSVPIDGILKHDNFFKIKRGEIAEYFLSESDGKNRAEFIKSVFNNDYTEFDVNGVRCGYKAWDDGLEIWMGNYLTKSADARVSWESAAHRIGELIERHEYLLDDKTFDIEPEVEGQGGYDSSQITLFDSDVPDTPESAAESKPVTAYRVGDFYEFYGEDAEIAAKVLELHISSRNGEPMVGIPQHALEQYTALLEKRGFKLTIQEYVAKDVPTETPLLSANVELISDVIDRLKRTEIDKESVYGEIDNVLAEMLFSGELTNDEEIFVTDLLNDEDEKIKVFEPRLSEPTFLEQAQKAQENIVTITQVAIESTDDFSDNGFHSETINTDIQNADGSYGEVKEYYRLVMVGENGLLKAYNDTVYASRDDARIAISKNADLIEIAYDDIIYKAADKRRLRNMHSEISENNSPLANFDKPSNFTIIDEHLGEGGMKTKFRANINAVKLLNTLESENRAATPEEQETLSKYVGWGGLPQAFDENNSAWSNEYMELLTLLSPGEYESAKGSTLNAHYTTPTVIRAIYDGLANLGFENGRVLEPAMGVGNFFGMMPENMRQSSLYGVELDGITGRIARQLYPNAEIQISGYENTNFPDNFFDVAIGNVPFGQYKLSEKRYDKLNLNIHDHFFAKSLDKIRPGGIIAFVTSKGTLDKENSKFRAYLAQRAELLGAIRLPNNAFKDNAGTEVTSDIIFLQKRAEMLENDAPLPDWVHLGKTTNGIVVNKYFEQHPEMMLGTMSEDGKMYGGYNTTCVPFEGADLKEQLDEAIKNIRGEIPDYIHEEPAEKAADSIPTNPARVASPTLVADPNTRNFSFTVVNGNIYYRENGEMFRQDLPKATADRVKGMIEIRDCVRQLIDMQLEEYSDDDIKAQQTELNRIYDRFTAKFGLLNDTANSRAFADDSSAPLLNSLEILAEDGKLKRKADMFTKRTIKPNTSITHADTAMDALAVSLSEKARVDMPFMEQLTGKTEGEIVNDLTGVIYRVPNSDKYEKNYVTADEYLSGNIRDKLQTARLAAELEPDVYGSNVAALETAMPKPLDASEIDVRLGATWIDTDTVKQFIVETIQPALYLQDMIKVNFSSYTSEWNIEGKSADRNNVMSTMTYGTERKNAYSIIEDTLNLRDARVYDRVEDANGKTKSVLNKKETTLAQEKQEAIKQAFKDWIFRDPERRESLVKKYNELFNSTKPREYDGSHLNFVGMSPEIQLRPHQLNAIAHTIYGGNTLLAHQVGAGKTFEMVASAMESKRLGLCHKSLFAVPNHLTEQMGAEFMRLYPSANILVATAADFEKKNRKRLISKIATGNYDAIIIGHSQLKKIPLSQERQESMLRQQIKEITTGIRQLAEQKGQHFSVKQLEKTKKSLEARLKKLLDTPKDDVVTFEELGIDKMYVDEAHEFKNLFLYTKMRNVAGIQQTEAEKSSDLYMKCQYMDELTGGKGTVFATGTPISNSMSELYTMMRYLQAHKLKEMGMHNFDAWAANFGEAVTAIELAPEGTGYRAKTRFSKFFNLPELMNVFKEAADIKTADDLNLDVPNAHFHNVVVKPSELQKEMVQSLSDRAAAVHNKQVAPEEDNMLKITNDGRKIGLDQRLINPDLPDEPNSKVNACVNNVFDIYNKTAEQKSAQLVFCDFSTPKGDDTFNLYDDIRSKLIAMGVPKEEIAFIHDADTEAKKRDLFAKVRSGKVRVMLGSTAKCGAGMNVQDKLVALHHLDCPWRPSDLEQREGRIIRQGNENSDVDIFRYVTEGTFDAYLYQMIENKQRFISQIMTSKSPVRSCEDVDEATLSYAEVKALCAGNPLIKEKMDLDVSVAKLKVLKSNFTSQQYRLEDKVLKEFPQKIQTVEGRIKALEKDLAHFRTVINPEEGISPMTIGGTTYTDKEQAGKALLLALKEVKSARESRHIGSYKGFELSASYDLFGNKYTLDIKRETIYKLELGNSDSGNITRIDNALQSLDKLLEGNKQQLDALHQQLDTAKSEMDKPFPREQELAEKLAHLNELNAQLNMDERGAEQDSSVDEDKPAPKKKLTLDERINNVRKQRSAEGQSNDSPGKNRDKTI